MWLPTSKTGIRMTLAMGLMLTMVGMTIGGNAGLQASTLDEAGINDTERAAVMGEHGNLQEYPDSNSGNMTEVPQPVRKRLFKPTLTYALGVADWYGKSVYRTSLPPFAYKAPLWAMLVLTIGVGVKHNYDAIKRRRS